MEGFFINQLIYDDEIACSLYIVNFLKIGSRKSLLFKKFQVHCTPNRVTPEQMLIPSNQLPKTRSKESSDPCHFIKNINSPYFLVAPKIFWGAKPRSNPWTSVSLLLNSSTDAFLQDFVHANHSKI